MPNVAAVLREEITRLAKKELKKTVDPVKRDNARLKRDVASLKRQVVNLTRDSKRVLGEVARLRKQAVDPQSEEVQSARFGPKLIAALRRRLKLSRESFAVIAGVSSNTVYLWEKGRNSPSSTARAKLLDLRSIGVREARRRVAEGR